MKAKVICRECQQHLNNHKESFCDTCGWDFKFAKYLSDNDWENLVNIHQKRTALYQKSLEDSKTWEAKNRTLQVNINQIIREIGSIYNDITLKEQELQGLSTLLEDKKKKKDLSEVDMESAQGNYKRLLENLKSSDSLIKNSIDYREYENKNIKVEIGSNNIFFICNFNYQPKLLMVLQKSDSILGAVEKGDIFININDHLKLKNSYSNERIWLLTLTNLEIPIKGRYFLNFTNVHTGDVPERLWGDRLKQFTFQ